MANNYVTLNGKRYRTTKRSFDPIENKVRQTQLTLTGKTARLDFGFTDYQWELDILVEITPEDSNYGSRAELKTAYGLDYVTFIDVDSTSWTVYFEGELSLSPVWALVDPSAPFEVHLSLRRRQT